jgi:hypothetical protein
VDPLSQVDNPPTDNESPGDGNALNAGGGNQQQAPRMSSRLDSLGVHHTRIDIRAMENAEARNIPGTNLNTHNSFDLLDDEEIFNRSLEMGIRPDSFSLQRINYLKDLETAKHAMATVQDSSDTTSCDGANQILLLGLDAEQSDSDRGEEEDDFTLVLSKRKKRAKKFACKIGRSGSQSKSSDATVGHNQNHVLSR